ncbi:AgmX/PglI C-terminal domain-containing protein [Chondromyces crocatus]|uniref:AgmX/PglI C-terminal domain-containing protein n=1 Tax=Chondromyces crocatus TaxID=52 RepID=UPI0014704295|nr:AgmX/PglI C-terminal domain-containing protein [Chondromyces crocatus]
MASKGGAAADEAVPGQPPPTEVRNDVPAPAATKPGDNADGGQRAAAVVGGDKIGGGTLTQDEIRRVVTERPELFDACYLIGAGKSRDFIATVTVRATLGPSGKVTVADVVRSTAKNKKVDTCVADAFKQLKFPSPRGATTSVITFPMEFQGAELVQ